MNPKRRQKVRLGDILIAAGLLTEEQLQKALSLQKASNERLGAILINEHFITEQDIVRVLSQQLGIQYVDLNTINLDPKVALIIPDHMAYKHQILPLKVDGNNLTLAMVDPLNLLAIDDIEILTEMHVEPVIVQVKDLESKLKEVYQDKISTEKMIKELDSAYMSQVAATGEAIEEVENFPVVRVVNSLFQQAVRERASDIHLDPQEKEIYVRFRVDGVLLEKMVFPQHIYPSISSRIKIMAELDISEKRIPQDGRSQIKVDNQEIDLRVATLPTIFGEKIVVRILRKDHILLELEKLGFSHKILPKLEELYQKPYGMILVTGPTGSGKTTTLYSILSDLNSVEQNILTIEDPVEYQLPRINQVQVNVKAGLNFNNALRSFLRQDPDIIMVGELRDEETVRIAIQAALTGHFVLSTLHTNDTAGSVSRLLDMGIEPFLITSSLLGVVAQRLARKICPHCKEPYVLEPEMVEKMGLDVSDFQNPTVYKGKGCPKCNNTGYLGRVALGELLIVSPGIRQLILAKAPAQEIQAQAIQEGMMTLYHSGLEKVWEGTTTVKELFRVTMAGKY